MLWNPFHILVAPSFRCVFRVKKGTELRSLACISHLSVSKRHLGSSEEECMETASQPTWKMPTDNANKWQLQPLIMLIKHCVLYHCNATANEDLSLNEEYNTIMDGQKKSSDHLSPAAVLACTLQHHHQHFLSPRRLLTQMARIWRFMVAESVYCFLFSLSTRSCYHQRNDAVLNPLQVSTAAKHNTIKKKDSLGL